MPEMSFREAAITVLERENRPLSYKEITKLALEEGLTKSQGETPEASMSARMSVDIARHGDASKFIRTAPGVFGLREWLGRDDFEEWIRDQNAKSRLRIPFFPTYGYARAMLPVIAEVERKALTALMSEVRDQMGTPKSQVDWTDPDAWISERLKGESSALAQRIWEQSNRIVNPRHMSGSWRLFNHYNMVDVDATGCIALTNSGVDFLEQPEGAAVQELDVGEGLDDLLAIISEVGPGTLGEFRPAFSELMAQESNFRAQSSIRAFLAARLRNLRERELVNHESRAYTISEKGLHWLNVLREDLDIPKPKVDELRAMIRERKTRVQSEIRKLISTMDPYEFEYLVKNLLEAMEYEDVEVTSKSGDGGVDVTARIQLGITDVKEVVQVKRHAKNIQRKTLDALRGCLHRFGAVRGTIITIGGFARGTIEAAFEPGAAPITLIDGNQLISLMIEHGIGVSKKNVELLEVDPSAFKELSE